MADEYAAMSASLRYIGACLSAGAQNRLRQQDRLETAEAEFDDAVRICIESAKDWRDLTADDRKRRVTP